MYPSPKNLLTDFAQHPEAQGAGGNGWFDLEDWVGPQHASKRGDVAKIEGILANSGDYSLERTQGPTGYWGLALDDGIRKYQKRNGLQVDGALRPGGPTIRHMQDEFGALLGSHTPPTPEDIDRHHDVVNDNNPGTIAWQQPPVSFADIPGLPEIDQEADASNARLVRAMLKTGDIKSYAPLMKSAIEQGGAGGLAEVRDLTLKLDEAQPGLGGKFASAVTGLLPKDWPEKNGVVVPKAPPKGAMQVAFTDIIGDAGMALMGGLLGAGTAAAGKHAIDETAKHLGKLPGFTPPADPDDRTRTRPGSEEIPTTISGPTSTGHPVELPDLPTTLVNIPQLPKEHRDTLVNDIVEQVFPNVLEQRYEDGREDKRGGPLTIKSNNIGAKKLQELILESDCPEYIAHVGGASQDGGGVDYVKELIVKAASGRDRRPDLSARFTDPNSLGTSEIHANTVTTDALGNPIPREAEAAEDMAEEIGDDRFGVFRKLKEGEDEEDYGRQFKDVLRQKLQPLINECKKKLGR